MALYCAIIMSKALNVLCGDRGLLLWCLSLLQICITPVAKRRSVHSRGMISQEHSFPWQIFPNSAGHFAKFRTFVPGTENVIVSVTNHRPVVLKIQRKCRYSTEMGKFHSLSQNSAEKMFFLMMRF